MQKVVGLSPIIGVTAPRKDGVSSWCRGERLT
jgi:hypothetical protein